MQTVFLGDYIRARRLELGLTQEQVCEGICEPITLSRVENGRQTPSRNHINAILQRLGLPDDRYFALLSKHEIEIDALQKEIISCNILHKFQYGLDKIRELEEITESDNYIIQQFILRSKVLLGKQESDGIHPYSFEEKLDLLMHAIRLTVPRFDLDDIHQHLYSLDEVKIINQIALTYSDHEENKKALDIYYQLLKYVQKHFPNISQSGGLLPLVAYNYARCLDLDGRYEDSLEMAQLGMQVCVQYGQYNTLPGTLAIMAECYHFMNQDSKSEEMYYQAYYTARSIQDIDTAGSIRREIKAYLGKEPKF